MFKRINYKLIFFLLLILFLSFFAIKPLLDKGFFPVHDNTQVERVFEMGQALKDGMFPVRWVKDLGYGYGYPIFNYYAPLSYYFAGLLLLFGINALVATKIMFIAGILLSGVFMYILARQLFGDVVGFLVSLVYLYAPYHALNIFVRGDVGEIWSYAFIPLVFYSLYKIYKTKRLIFSPLLGISFALIILSHNLSAFMISPFVLMLILVFLYVSIRNKDFRIFKLSLLGLILGLLLSSFYFIPALTEMKYTNVNSIIGGGSDFKDHFVCVSQFWSSPWGFGGSNPGCVDGLSFRLGKILIVAVILTLLIFVPVFKKFNKENKTIFAILFLGLTLSILFSLGISKPIWDLITPMEFIQFPWRFLAFISFFSSLLVGFLFLNLSHLFPNKKRIILLIVCILLSGNVISNLKLFIPQTQVNYSLDSYTKSSHIKWTTSKISDEYMPSHFNTPRSESDVPVSLLQDNNLLHNVVIDSTRTKEIVGKFPITKVYVINTAYFPAWKAYLNTNEIPVLDVGGKIGVRVEKGYGLIQLKFVSTKVEKSSNLFTLIGLISTFAAIILGIRRKNEKIS